VSRPRPALSSDLESLASIHVEAWQGAYRDLIPERFLAKVDLEHGRRRLVQLLGVEPPRVLLVEDEAGPTGFCRFGPANGAPGSAEVFAINVRPSHWRRGQGKLLLEATLAQLEGEGFGQVWLWVLTHNSRARAFYEALGWVADGAQRVEGEAEGACLEELRYRISLER